MFMDYDCIFSDDQAVTATASSTNVIDLGATSSKVNSPNEQLDNMKLNIEVTTAFASSTNTIQVKFVTSDTATGARTVLASSDAIAASTTLVKGYKFSLPLPTENLKRFIALEYHVVSYGVAISAGNIHAALVLDKQTGV